MKSVVLSMVFFLLVVIFSIIDLTIDITASKWTVLHGWIEFITLFLSLIGVSILIRFIYTQHVKIQGVSKDLTSARESLSQTSRISAKLSGELSQLIQTQFDEWLLTPSEKEIALLILKGLTLEEVAKVRDTKEKTVRQQASHLYKKAGISGRHELVAYFFEDFLR